MNVHTEPTWEFNTRVPSGLSEAELHVWIATVPAPTAVANLARILSPDEVARAERYHKPESAATFIVARAILRALLAEYLATAPSSIRFAYSATGRPSVEYPRTDIDVSIAHSANTILIGASRRRRLGVDIEYIFPTFDFSEVAASAFGQEEQMILDSVRDSQRRRLFFTLWTAREALAKACGAGLMTPLSELGLSLKYSPDGAVQVMHNNAEPYQCVILTPLHNYAAAVAYTGSACATRLLSYTGVK
jgi:4'-phosphopantetheinyl transferase